MQFKGSSHVSSKDMHKLEQALRGQAQKYYFELKRNRKPVEIPSNLNLEEEQNRAIVDTYQSKRDTGMDINEAFDELLKTHSLGYPLQALKKMIYAHEILNFLKIKAGLDMQSYSAKIQELEASDLKED